MMYVCCLGGPVGVVSRVLVQWVRLLRLACESDPQRADLNVRRKFQVESAGAAGFDDSDSGPDVRLLGVGIVLLAAVARLTVVCCADTGRFVAGLGRVERIHVHGRRQTFRRGVHARRNPAWVSPTQ